MSDLIEFSLDDRWHFLRGMACDRRARVFQTTTDAAARQHAVAEEDAARSRIAELQKATLAREAGGDWQAEWDDLVAAVFGPDATVSSGADGLDP